ncbi:MAG: hypothetical protein K2M05_08760 [Paramuribaculum sp.]|nr:hypothetical protein [Paramuribaculum sp.]MDE6304362.1 hypothetical protein [Paramuribaculum sp.]
MRWIVLTVVTLLSLMVTALSAPRRVKTTRGNRLKAEYVASVTASPDSVAGDSVISHIGLSGYDKPLRSRRESMFVTNRSQRHVSALEVLIAYTDMSGRTLHRRSVTLKLDLSPGETSRVEFGSWDSQQSFYYHRSPRPAKAQATPYNIKCRISSLSSGDTIFVSSSSDKIYEQKQ